MNTVFSRRRAERFARRLDGDGGRHQRSRQRVDSPLAALVCLTERLRSARLPDPDPDFRADLRAQLIAAAERDGIGRRMPRDLLGD